MPGPCQVVAKWLITPSSFTDCDHLQVVDMKGEPFMSGLVPSLPDLSKKFASLGMQVTSLLNPRYNSRQSALC